MAEVDQQSLQGQNPEEASTHEPRNAAEKRALAKPRGPKNIVVCCDGTGNEFSSLKSLDGNSNVVKFYTALDLNHDQVAYYHPGVGTLGDPTKTGLSRKWSVIKGLAFAYGFRDNVLDAYRYLMQHYAAGDHVYLFGFSRGAYTVRALAGLLHGYGLLCRGNEGHIPYAWRMYKQSVVSQKQLRAHTIVPDDTFRDTFSHRDFSIHFMGTWDTVSSVGWIRSQLKLLDLAQNPSVQRIRHAVSIDERRCFYQDNLVGPSVTVSLPAGLQGKPLPPGFLTIQDVEQVWFAGVHSDVGGSYPQLESGLSNITLQWMLDQADKAGIRICPVRRSIVLGEPLPQQATPEIAELGRLYERPKQSPLHRSLHGIWWLLEVLPHRYYDKDDETPKMRLPFGAYREIPAGAKVHPSVLERLHADPCYRPQNVSAAELFPLPSSDSANPDGIPYLEFKPSRCRCYPIRSNWFFTFAAETIEIALACYAVFVTPFVLYRYLPWGTWCGDAVRLGQWIDRHAGKHLAPSLGYRAFLLIFAATVVLTAFNRASQALSQRG